MQLVGRRLSQRRLRINGRARDIARPRFMGGPMFGQPKKLGFQRQDADVTAGAQALHALAVVEHSRPDLSVGEARRCRKGVDQAQEGFDVDHTREGKGFFPRPQDVLRGNIPLPDFERIGHHGGMVKAPKKRISPQATRLHQRVLERLASLGKSEIAASQEAGLGKSFIRDIGRRGAMPSAVNLARLAGALGVAPEWLLGNDQASAGASAPARSAAGAPGAPYLGEVAAGQWLEIAPFDPDPAASIPVLDMRYPASAQYALGVRGTSINRVARPGSILLCVDLARAGIEISNGDLVVVQRKRAQGGLVEVTAKRFRRRSSTVVELTPESDDPRWRDPIVLDDAKARDDEEVAVIALVTGVYRPTHTSADTQ